MNKSITVFSRQLSGSQVNETCVMAVLMTAHRIQSIREEMVCVDSLLRSHRRYSEVTGTPKIEAWLLDEGQLKKSLGFKVGDKLAEQIESYGVWESLVEAVGLPSETPTFALAGDWVHVPTLDLSGNDVVSSCIVPYRHFARKNGRPVVWWSGWFTRLDVDESEPGIEVVGEEFTLKRLDQLQLLIASGKHERGVRL